MHYSVLGMLLEQQMLSVSYEQFAVGLDEKFGHSLWDEFPEMANRGMCTGTLFGEINSYRCIIKGVYPLLFILTTIFTNLGEYYYSVDRTDESDSGSGI